MKTALLILGLMALPMLVGYYFKTKSDARRPAVSAPRIDTSGPYNRVR